MARGGHHGGGHHGGGHHSGSHHSGGGHHSGHSSSGHYVHHHYHGRSSYGFNYHASANNMVMHFGIGTDTDGKKVRIDSVDAFEKGKETSRPLIHGRSWTMGDSYCMDLMDPYVQENLPKRNRRVTDLMMRIYACAALFFITFTNIVYELLILIFENINMTDDAFEAIDNIIYYGQFFIPVIVFVIWSLREANKNKVNLMFCRQMMEYYAQSEEKEQFERTHMLYTICPSCGAPRSEGNHKCLYCGTLLFYNKPTDTMEDATFAEEKVEPAPYRASGEAFMQDEKKRRFLAIFIVTCVAMVFITVITLITSFGVARSKKNTSNPGKQTQQTQQVKPQGEATGTGKQATDENNFVERDWDNGIVFIDGVQCEFPCSYSAFEDTTGYQLSAQAKDEQMNYSKFATISAKAMPAVNAFGAQIDICVINDEEGAQKPTAQCTVMRIDCGNAETGAVRADLKLSNGIGIGSTYDEIVAAMGQPDYDLRGGSIGYIRYYFVQERHSEGEVYFSLKDGAVSHMIISDYRTLN